MPTSSVVPGVALRATFILANPAGLLALDDRCQPIGALVALPPRAAPAAPSLHPDGRSIVFALTVQHETRGFGSGIYRLDLDGTGLRPLLEHEEHGVFYASPVYDPTGIALYVHRRAPLMIGGEFRGVSDSIERIDLATGERRRIRDDAADHTLSPDGRTLLFVRMLNGQVQDLWRADPDGADARPFFTGRDRFIYQQSPRFHPSGREIAFSAAGHTVAEHRRGGGLGHLGIPSDVFLAPIDGGSIRAIGRTDDDVVPAWSKDGRRLAYVGSGAMYLMDVGQPARSCAEGQDLFFGDLLWLR